MSCAHRCSAHYLYRSSTTIVVLVKGIPLFPSLRRIAASATSVTIAGLAVISASSATAAAQPTRPTSLSSSCPANATIYMAPMGTNSSLYPAELPHYTDIPQYFGLSNANNKVYTLPYDSVLTTNLKTYRETRDSGISQAKKLIKKSTPNARRRASISTDILREPMLLLTSSIPLRKGTAPLAKVSWDPQSCKVTPFGKLMGLLISEPLR